MTPNRFPAYQSMLIANFLKQRELHEVSLSKRKKKLCSRRSRVLVADENLLGFTSVYEWCQGILLLSSMASRLSIGCFSSLYSIGIKLSSRPISLPKHLPKPISTDQKFSLSMFPTWKKCIKKPLPAKSNVATIFVSSLVLILWRISLRKLGSPTQFPPTDHLTHKALRGVQELSSVLSCWLRLVTKKNTKGYCRVMLSRGFAARDPNLTQEPGPESRSKHRVVDYSWHRVDTVPHELYYQSLTTN